MIKEIPSKYIYKCDVCGSEEEKLSKSRPKYWSELSLKQDAYDYQGCAVADGSVNRLLCWVCTQSVIKTLNEL